MRGALKCSSLALIMPLFVAEHAHATLVIPSGLDNTASTLNVNSPFGNNTSSGFVLQIDYAASQLSTVAIGSVIDGFGFRLFSDSGTIRKALSYTSFDVQIGQSANPIAGLSSTFADNLGADTVMARSGALKIAAGSLIGNKLINPFYTINFATPYIYKGGDLLITIQDTLAANSQNVVVPLDAVNTSSSIGDVGAVTGDATSGYANFFYAPVTQLDFGVAAVPEPATWAMMIAGLGLVGAMRQRRKQPTS